MLIAACIAVFPGFSPGFSPVKMFFFASLVGIWLYGTLCEAKAKQFHSPRLRDMWLQCKDRMKRFDEVMARVRKDKIVELEELPRTLARTSESVYAALRRADQVTFEILKSERGISHAMPPRLSVSHDPQSTELYRIADKNLAEYRQHYSAVMAGVQQAEAQAEVFKTTVDTLRIRLLGMRLAGRSPQMASAELLTTLAEAKLQMQAINSALDELDLGLYPRTIEVVSPTAGSESDQTNDLGQSS